MVFLERVRKIFIKKAPKHRKRLPWPCIGTFHMKSPHDVRNISPYQLCQQAIVTFVLHRLHTQRSTMRATLVNFIRNPTSPFTDNNNFVKDKPHESNFLWARCLCQITLHWGLAILGRECFHSSTMGSSNPPHPARFSGKNKKRICLQPPPGFQVKIYLIKTFKKQMKLSIRDSMHKGIHSNSRQPSMEFHPRRHVKPVGENPGRGHLHIKSAYTFENQICVQGTL